MFEILISTIVILFLVLLGTLEYVRFLRKELVKTKQLTNYRIAKYKEEIKDLVTELEKP